MSSLADLLGSEYPMLAFSHCLDVVAAVTNDGGFGVLGAVAHTSEQLEIDLAWIEDRVGGRPYGVDLLLPQKYEDAEQGGLDCDTLRQLLPAEQQAFVDDILDRYQVPPLSAEHQEAVARLGGLDVSPKGYGPLLDVAYRHDIKLIASALRRPSRRARRAHPRSGCRRGRDAPPRSAP